MNEQRLAVCSWSLQPKDAEELIERVRDCGLSRVQLHLDPIAEDKPGWSDTPAKLRAAGIDVVSGMIGCVGEDYSTIESIHRTGGVVPDATWPATRERMKKAAPVAKQLGLKLVTFHAGFIPADPTDAVFKKVLTRMRESASIFADAGAAVAMETGQESADALASFLHLVGAGIGVNFDPANMLLYGSGEPIAALKKLLPSVKQVHLKDAIPSGKAGEWGTEVPLGQGKVDWPAFFTTLKSGHFSGNCVIEREAGGSRIADIKTAAALFREHAR
jgi:sugar phosphate isomerase/epimerase